MPVTNTNLLMLRNVAVIIFYESLFKLVFYICDVWLQKRPYISASLISPSKIVKIVYYWYFMISVLFGIGLVYE